MKIWGKHPKNIIIKVLNRILITVGCLIAILVLLVIGLLVALTIPSIQQKAASSAADILSEKLGIEASVGHFSVRAPFNVLLKDVFVSDGQGDTLAYMGCLDVRLRIDALPDSIAVKHLEIDNLTTHTGDLIPSLKIDGKVGRLSAGVGAFGLEKLAIPVRNVILENADVTLVLEDSDDNEEEPADSTALALSIDIQDLVIRNVDFRLEPIGLKLNLAEADASALVDLETSCYTVRSLNIADTKFGIGDFSILVGKLGGDAVVDLDNSYISSNRLYASVPEFKADVTLHNTAFDLAEMRAVTNADGSFAGSKFKLDADYDIDEEIFKADLAFGRMDLARILNMTDNELVVAGHIRASGVGIDPSNPGMHADVDAQLDSCRFDGIDVSGISLIAKLNKGIVNGTLSTPIHYRDSSVAASLMLDSRFAANDFLGKYPEIDLDASLGSIDARIPGDTLQISRMNLGFKTGMGLCDASVNMPGIDVSANIPAHVLEIPSLIPSFSGEIKTLAAIDSLIAAIPEVNADLKIRQDNPFRGMLQKRGLDLKELALALRSAGIAKKLNLTLETPELEGEYKLPAINASLTADMYGSSIDGELKLADIVYEGKYIGDKNMIFDLRPDNGDLGHFIAHAYLDDIPVELAKQFVTLPEDIDIQGKIRVRAAVSGLPDKISIFAGVKPLDVAVAYNPYDVQLRLGEQEITMEDNYVNLNGLSIIGADSTSVALNGGLDLNTMLLDVSVKSDSFEPVKLPKGGHIPVYGNLLLGLDGSITGPVDSLLAGVDVRVLPGTDITYPIDEKNMAQVIPSGTVKVGYNTKTGLSLGGQLDVPKGKLFYSPKLYPIMPFSIDKDSHIKFNGAIDDTELAVSASQNAKATYKPVGEASRMVDFITGVKVGGSLKNIDIGFYLDAPKDKEIQRELSEMPEEDREGLAAVLLATGMYASESNEAAQMDGYALSSIVQSRLNAATSNKLGGKVNLDFGVAKGKHGSGVESTDYNINISKSFLDDRLNIKLGAGVSDNADVNKNSTSFINNMSAEYKLDTAGMLKVRLFSMKDFNNIVEGELVKSGAGVLFNKTLVHQRDSLDRSLDMEVEGNVVYRSNNQLGPDASILLSKQNLFSRNDVFTTKIEGAYYWNLNQKKQNDPSRNDTYILGADFSLNFPFLQLGNGMLKYTGQTLYRLGYLNQNVSGNYGMHKLYGGVEYSLRQNKYLTHTFSPAYISVVLADKASEDLTKNLSLTELLKLFAGNEFIPSAKYSFSYNNYRDKNRDIYTAMDIQLKESANLISGIMAACGRDFNEKNKLLLGINYDQFVKYKFELRNKFRLHDKLELATRAIVGAVISFGNSVGSPLSEAFSIGGPNSIRAFSPRAIGPGDFNNENFSAQIFHTGDMKLELNAELRFPIVWKLNGALFVDAGNVWNQRSPREYMSEKEIQEILKAFNLTSLYNSQLEASTFLNQLALGTGAGLRLDYESIVIRLDLGIAIHAPYDTGRIGYYNIPNFWKDGVRLNFGIGYPF